MQPFRVMEGRVRGLRWLILCVCAAGDDGGEGGGGGGERGDGGCDAFVVAVS